MPDQIDTQIDTSPTAAPIDVFELGFRLFGNEIFAMSVTSQSRVKNWAFFGVLTLVVITVLVANLGPDLVNLFEQMQSFTAPVIP